MIFPLVLLLALFQTEVHAGSSKACSEVSGVSNADSCMVTAVDREHSTAVFSLSKCFVCHPSGSLTKAACHRGNSETCIGYKFRHANSVKEIVLLRTHKASRESPYELLKNGALNSNLLLSSLPMSDHRSHKSPLFDLAHKVGVRHVELQLLDSSGNVVVKLRFKFTGKLKEGNWFSKDNLVSSSPWSLNAMKGDTYNFFSVDGAVEHNGAVKRRFYINKVWGGCSHDEGYMVVSEAEGCGFWQVERPAYIWNPKASDTWMSKHWKLANVFQLVGILDNNAGTKVRYAGNEP